MAIATADQIRRIIADKLNQDLAAVTDDAHIQDDLGADSLDVVEIGMVCEDEFGVTIPDEELENLTTVGKVIAYVTSHSGS